MTSITASLDSKRLLAYIGGKEDVMYQQMIRETLARTGRIGVEPRHVEAFMRGESGTLDHLGGATWNRAVKEAVACVDAAGPEMAEAIAQSYGL